MPQSDFHASALTAPAPRLSDYRQLRYAARWFALGSIRLLGALPTWVRAPLGALVGLLGSLFYRTPTIPTNLALCFPQLDARARNKIARRYFAALGAVVLDLGVAWCGSARRLKRLAHIRGGEHLERARAAGRAVILLAPHFAGLEIGWARLALEWPMIGMYRRPRDPLLHHAILHFRTRFGGLALERFAGLKPLVRQLRDGRAFYYLPDQDPDRPTDNYVFAPFFGVPTATFTALGRLAEITGAAVIPCVTHWRGFARGYEIVLAPPLEGYPSGDELTDTQRMNAAIEELVRATPTQYFWSYRRFKTRPDGAASPYRRA